MRTTGLWQGWKLAAVGAAVWGLAVVAGGWAARGEDPAEGADKPAEGADKPTRRELIERRILKLSGAPSTHWLGLGLRPLDDALRAQLALEGGLVVEHVAPEAPAARAGVQPHDIVLKFADNVVADEAQLMAAVDKNQEQEAELQLLRAGKPLTVKVTPAKRPAVGFAPLGGPVRQWIERAAPGEREGVFRFVHPGVELAAVEFPKDLQVTISKAGQEPANIVVKQGDKTWNVTERELDKLPEEVRGHVARLLGRGDVLFQIAPGGGGGFGGFGGGFGGLPQPQAVPAVPVPAPARIQVRPLEGDPRVEKRLDELERKLDELKKLLEKQP